MSYRYDRRSGRRWLSTAVLAFGLLLLVVILSPADAAADSSVPLSAVAEESLENTNEPDVPYDPEWVSAGADHTCALTPAPDHKVRCWGSNKYGQAPNMVSGPFQKVSAGAYHTCALKQDGSAVCWGQNTNGEAQPPTGKFIDISAGQEYTCALRENGQAVCWGKDYRGNTKPRGGIYKQIGAHSTHTCGLKNDGSLDCWGYVGPRLSDYKGPYKQVTVGTCWICGLKRDGNAFCFMECPVGVSPLGTEGLTADSISDTPPGPFVQLSLGGGMPGSGVFACGLKPDGSIRCWGSNDHNQGSNPVGRFRQIGSGYRHACGLERFGDIDCWGDDKEGQATPPDGPFGQIIGPPVAVDDSYRTGIGEPLIVGSPAILANDVNALGDPRVYYLDANGHISELAWFSNWWNHYDLTQYTGAPLPVAGSELATVTVNGDPRIYYFAPSATDSEVLHISELAWYDGGWHHLDLMSLISSFPADNICKKQAFLAGMCGSLSAVAVGDESRVYYLDQFQHINELASSNQSWSHKDATQSASGTPAKPNSPLAASKTTNGDPAIYYISNSYTIHELAWYGDEWLHWDLMSATAAPIAARDSALSVISVRNHPHIYYQTVDYKVQELAWSDGEWQHDDLFKAFANVTPNSATGDLRAITITNGDPCVYYVDSDGHINELAWHGGSWHYSDLTANTKGKAASGGDLAVTTARLDPRIYYETDNQHLHELAWVVNRWYASDTTQRSGGAAALSTGSMGATTANVDPLTAVPVKDAAHGSLELSSNGSFKYTPQTGYEGVDRFTYRASDWWSLSEETTVNLTVGPPLVVLDVDIELYNNPLGTARGPYENIIGYFADALYESSNGARKLGTVTFYGAGNNPSDVEVFWFDECHPSASVSGYGTVWGSVSMCDEFWAQECKPSQPCQLVFLYDYMADDEHQRAGGYTIAHEWGHYYFGLYDEYRGLKEYDTFFSFPHSTDTPVPNSIMNSQSRAIGGDLNWLNFSIAKNFNMDTAQGRVYGASAWETLSRPQTEDPRNGQRSSATRRRPFPDLQKVRPKGSNDSPIELPGSARSELSIVWVESPKPMLDATSSPAAPVLKVTLSSILGTSIAYPDPILLRASVGNELPLTGVGVRGSMRSPDGSKKALTFSDSGQPPDEIEGDGLYSAIAEYNVDGTYEIEVHFDNDAGTAVFVSTSLQPSAGPGGEAALMPPPVPYPGNFDLVEKMDLMISGTMADDHGDSTESARSVTANNDAEAGKIDMPGDKDVFRFKTLTSGTTYVRVTDLALGAKPRLRVLGSDGRRVLYETGFNPEFSAYPLIAIEGVAPGAVVYAEVSDDSSMAYGGLYEFSAGTKLPSDVEQKSYLPAIEVIPGTNWKAGVQAQNGGTAAAPIALTTYLANGQPHNCGAKDTAPGESANFLSYTDCAPPHGPLGSGVLQAEGQPLSSIVMMNNSTAQGTGFAGASYTGMSEAVTSTTLFFPLVKQDHNGRTTTFSVQNASDKVNDITVVFRVNGEEYTKEYEDIPPYTSVLVMPVDAGVPGGYGQVGSLTVTGAHALAGTSLEHEHNVSTAENLQASTAFTPADFDETLFCPLVRNGHTSKGLTSGVQVQNVAATTNEVTFSYTSVDGGVNVVRKKSVAPGASATFYTPLEGVPEGSLGAVTLTAEGKIVAVVNERGVLPEGRILQTTYACFGAESASDTILVPLYKEFYKGNTAGIQVQNVSGDGQAATVTLEYRVSGPGERTGEASFAHKTPVMDGASITFWGVSILREGSDLYAVSGDPDSLLGTYGSVVIRSDRPVVAIVNESTYGLNGEGSRQDSKNYEGFNVQESIEPAHQEQIIFVSNRHGNEEIYVMDSDGSNIKRLTNHPAGDWAANYAHDGERIVFTSDRDGDMELYIMDDDGSNITQLTNNSRFDCCASWSPLDTQLVFNANGVGGAQDIYSIFADGSGMKNLTNHAGEDWSPVWSPDGKKIAFYSSRSGQNEIYAMNADGSGLTNLTQNPAEDWGPDWSPDGKTIAFHSDREGNLEIYTMNADGSGQRNLTQHPAKEFSPGWSPDGRLISFTSDRDGNGEIYVMNADGSKQVRLTNNPAEDTGSSWRP